MATRSRNIPKRIVIEGIDPEIDEGRFPAKRVVGETLTVEADVYADGHDELSVILLWKKEGQNRWNEAPMQPLGNDRWRASFSMGDFGVYRYTISAWVNQFGGWKRDLKKRLEAGQDVAVDLQIGAGLIQEIAPFATPPADKQLSEWASKIAGSKVRKAQAAAALDDEMEKMLDVSYPRQLRQTYERELPVMVEPERARFSAWYEMFPRSSAAEPGRHGTFRDVENRLPYMAELGFDVLYLPPIHPIGRTFRKGRNNSVESGASDPGSPWAIGSKEGGHKAVHPELGKPADFKRLIAKARKLNIEIALDIAFQVSPDHPYVTEHPSWFRKRPDGSIQYAENPPKKYQDIYPFDFECDDWKELWNEAKSIFEFWIEMGVNIFRVDNPHTKPFRFWEWCIAEIKARRPDVIFLSEAFTRPKIMYQLAKAGFSQSYTYFPWRTQKWELGQYAMELTRKPVSDFFRPNHWTNTPDILIDYLQKGGLPAFRVRFILAAMLGANYGIYGPLFELGENLPAREGSEEYLDSEKYQIRSWNLEAPLSLRYLIKRVNAIRRENRALQSNEGLCFHDTDNEQIVCFSKRDATGKSVILVTVNLDPSGAQHGFVTLKMDALGLEWDAGFSVVDLLTGARYQWQGKRNFVELNPDNAAGHVFRVGS